MKKNISIFLILTLIITFVPTLEFSVFAESITSGNWTCTLDANNQATITACNEYGGTITVPASLDGYTVIGFGEKISVVEQI